LLNLPNKITISRIILIPVFMAFLLSKASLTYLGVAIQWGAIVAGAIFVLAAVTDGLDGYIARRHNLVTSVGQLLDPLADKLLVSSALISLVGLGRLSAWIAVVIIGREFAVTGLRMSAAVKHVVIPAGKWGKAKTVFQILAIVFLILKLPVPVYAPLLEDILLGVALVLTVVSGIEYFARGSHVLLDDEPPV
jgi:CDP-diacylglycerol---glycerol-3-phosphate 3-phosphatidyltransferase